MPSRAGNFQISQDWEPVVFNKNSPSGQGSRPKPAAAKKAELLTAQRQGQTATEKKPYSSGNHVTTARMSAAKLDAETEGRGFEPVSMEFRKALMQARCARGWTQKELAQQVGVQPGVIQEYESGNVKGKPDGCLVSRISQKLGVRLPKYTQ